MEANLVRRPFFGRMYERRAAGLSPAPRYRAV
jgi:hypothetical protein